MNTILDYFIDMIPVLIITAPPYAIFRLLYLKKSTAKLNAKREIVLALFCFYAVWLATETVLPEFSITIVDSHIEFMLNLRYTAPALERLEQMNGINFVPFLTIAGYTSFKDFGVSAVNIIGNILAFVPLGMFLPSLFKKLQKIWPAFFIGVLTSCTIEFVQLFIGRSVDIDDIILNSLGVLIGNVLIALVFALHPWGKTSCLKHTGKL